MGARLELIAFAGALALGACSSSSSSSTAASSPTASRPPSSGSSSSGPTSSFETPETCPNRSGAAPIAKLTEALVRERIAGIYRSCNSSEGVEIRIEEGTGAIAWWALDERFVRIAEVQYLDVTGCNGDSCTVVWHPDADAGGSDPGFTQTEMRLYADPTAIELDYPPGGQAASDPSEWVRVAD